MYLVREYLESRRVHLAFSLLLVGLVTTNGGHLEILIFFFNKCDIARCSVLFLCYVMNDMWVHIGPISYFLWNHVPCCIHGTFRTHGPTKQPAGNMTKRCMRTLALSFGITRRQATRNSESGRKHQKISFRNSNSPSNQTEG